MLENDTPKKLPFLKHQIGSFKLIISLSIVLNLILIGFVLLLIYQNQLLKQNLLVKRSQIEPLNTTQSSPIPTSSLLKSPNPKTVGLDLNADWLSYENQNINYTFQYPKGITITEENTIYLFLRGPTQEEIPEFYDGISLSFSFPFQIENIDLEEYINKKITEGEKIGGKLDQPLKSININGLNGYSYSFEALGVSQMIYLESKDKNWIVEIVNKTNDPTNQGYQEIVDNIIGSFEFK